MNKLNKKRISQIIKKLESNFGSFSNKKVGILGLACKQGTDDVRESPAIKVIEILKKKKAKITAYDPLAIENAKRVLSDVAFAKNSYEVAKDADCLLVLADWPEFGKLDYGKIKKLMKVILFLIVEIF